MPVIQSILDHFTEYFFKKLNGYVDIFLREKFGLLSTDRCHNCIGKNSYENDQENKYERIRRLDTRMKVMNECRIGLC